MTKIDTIVLIDCYEHSTLGPKFDKEQHKAFYYELTSNLSQLIKTCNVDNLILSAYGSNHETTHASTDLIIKSLSPLDITRHSMYSVEENTSYFHNKNVMVGGVSLHTCVKSRPLGLRTLFDNYPVKGVYSFPGIVGFYGPVGSTIDSLYAETKIPLKITMATNLDFETQLHEHWVQQDEIYPHSHIYSFRKDYT